MQQDKPLRVLQVAGRMDRGGLETLIMNLYRAIDTDKLQFDFAIHTEDECEYSKEIRLLGGNIYSIPRIQDVGPVAYRKYWREFLTKHDELRIIHGHMRSTASIYLSEARKAGRFAIAHSHNTSSGRGIKAIAKNVLQMPLRFCADWYIGCSIPSAQWLFGKNIINRPNFSVIKNVVDTNRFVFNANERIEKRKELGLAETDKVIFSMGRLEPEKNWGYIRKIYEASYEMDKNIRILMCGVGPEETDIIEWIKSNGFEEKAKYLGSRSDIPGIMAAADLFLMPSIFEGFPVSLIEAQSSGLNALIADNITDEVVITDLLEKLPIDIEPQVWAKKLIDTIEVTRNSTDLETYEEKRKEYAGIVKQSGYDVATEAEKLTQFYTKINEKQNH